AGGGRVSLVANSSGVAGGRGRCRGRVGTLPFSRTDTRSGGSRSAAECPCWSTQGFRKAVRCKPGRGLAGGSCQDSTEPIGDYLIFAVLEHEDGNQDPLIPRTTYAANLDRRLTLGQRFGHLLPREFYPALVPVEH